MRNRTISIMAVLGSSLLVLLGAQAAGASDDVDPTEVPGTLTEESWTPENIARSKAALEQGITAIDNDAPTITAEEFAELEAQRLLPSESDTPEIALDKIDALADTGLFAGDVP